MRAASDGALDTGNADDGDVMILATVRMRATSIVEDQDVGGDDQCSGEDDDADDGDEAAAAGIAAAVPAAHRRRADHGDVMVAMARPPMLMVTAMDDADDGEGP